MSEQKYMPTKSYFEPTPAEARELVREAADLHETIDARDTSWLDRTRATGRLKTVERLIQTSRAADRRAEQVQVRQVRQVQRSAAPPGYAVSDCGTAYMRVQNAEPQYMESVPYYLPRKHQ